MRWNATYLMFTACHSGQALQHCITDRDWQEETSTGAPFLVSLIGFPRALWLVHRADDTQCCLSRVPGSPRQVGTGHISPEVRELNF